MRAKRWFLILPAACGLALGCAHSNEKDGPVIEDLEIEGTDKVDDGDVKDTILTAESSWIPFLPKKRFDRNIWSSDLQRIERYYQSQGFFQAQVVEEQVEQVDDDAVEVRVRVREGAPTKVAQVCIVGLEDLPEDHRARVLSKVPLNEGDVFVEDAWEGMKGGLQQELVSLGYAEATVTGNAKVDLGTQEAFIDLEIDPGMRYRLEGVEVVQRGTTRVEEWRIEEQVREALEQKTFYSPEAQHEAQQRVFDMGVFGATQVFPGAGNPETGTIPLVVEVTEAPFHDVGGGFGVGFDQDRQEAHVIGEYENRDFLGGLRRLTVESRLGYAFIPNAFTRGDAVTRSGPIALLRTEVEQPRLFHPNFKLRAEIEGERALEPAYSFTGGRARIGVPWRPRTWLEIEPSYNYELYFLTAGETSLTGDDAPELLFGCGAICRLSYLEQRIAYDRRDDPQEPRKGVYLALSFQEGGGFLGGNFDYLRIVPEARGYLSFLPGRRLTFAGRVRTGSLIPLNGGDLDSPIIARFFSGGDDMRGFSARRLAPMRIVEKTDPRGEYNGEPVPIGGNGMFEASFETRYEVVKGVIVAGFVDTGFVTSEDLQLNPAFIGRNLLWAVGTGVRYITPVGPIRLDLAYRLPVGPGLRVYQEDAALTAAPSNGCFGFGSGRPGVAGAPEGLCAIHLSIGEAF